MAVRSTQGQNRAVRSTQGGRGVSPSIVVRELGQTISKYVKKKMDKIKVLF